MRSCRILPVFRIIVPLLLLLSVSVPAQQTNAAFRLARALEKNQEFAAALQLYKQLYAADDRDIAVIRGIKSCYLGLHQYGELIKFLKQVISASRAGHSWENDLAEAYYLNDQRAEAIDTWWRQISKSPKNIAVYRLVGAAMVRQRLFDEAIKVYKTAMDRIKGQENLHIDIANLHRAQMDYASATEQFLQYYLSRPKQKAFLQRELLRLSDRKDQAPRVVATISNFLEKNPGYDEVREILAGLYIKEKDYSRAYQIYKKLERPKTKGIYLQRFAVEAARNKAFEHAINAYRDITRLYPGSVISRQAEFQAAKCHAQLAYQFRESGDEARAAAEMARARSSFDRVAASDKNNGDKLQSFLQLGNINFRFYYDLDRAIANYKNYIAHEKRNKNRESVMLRLGQVYLAKNDISQALATYRRIKHKSYRTDAAYRIAEIRYFQGDFSTALASLQQLLSMAGMQHKLANDMLARINLINGFRSDSLTLRAYAGAELLEVQNKLSQAADIMRDLAATRSSLAPHAGRHASRLYMELQKFDPARDVLLALQSAWPQDLYMDETVYLLAVTEEKSGNFQQALAYYRELLTKHPNSLHSDQARRRARHLDQIVNREQS